MKNNLEFSARFILFLCSFLFNRVLLAQSEIGVKYILCTNCEDEESLGNDPSFFEYGSSPTFYQAANFGSDFGPRPYGLYDWHNGIDISAQGGDNDLGDKICSIVDGDIMDTG